MKKLSLLASALFLMGGVAFADGGKKDCCSKDSKHAKTECSSKEGVAGKKDCCAKKDGKTAKTKTKEEQKVALEKAKNTNNVVEVKRVPMRAD